MKKYIVFGLDRIHGFSHVIVTAPNEDSALIVAEALHDVENDPFRGNFKALRALDAGYLRVLANDVDVAAQPKGHVWKKSRHGGRTFTPLGDVVSALDLLERQYVEGEHGRDCTSCHAAGECDCGRADMAQALKEAGRGV